MPKHPRRSEPGTPPRKPRVNLRHASALLRAHCDAWRLAVSGRTVAQLARLTRIPESTLSLWCSGRRALPLGHPDFHDLCGELALSPHQRRELAEAYGLDPKIGGPVAERPIRSPSAPSPAVEAPLGAVDGATSTEVTS